MDRIFENTATAFALKSNAELERAYYLFRMISNEPLVKIGTSLTNFAIKANLPVEGLIRTTVFDHFCGGVNEEDCMPVVERMWEKGVCTVLDYSVEGKDTEDPLDDALAKTLEIMEFVRLKDAMPFAVFKPTGLGRFALFQKVSAGQPLTTAETAEWERVIRRFDTACKKAYDLGVSLLIDAEESWMQPAADQLVEEMMRAYNTKERIVFNTLQMYRWDRMEYFQGLQERARRDGFRIGIKIVRGAYLEKENERAEEKGYPTPICASKAETDANFDAAVRYALDHLDIVSLFAGTHNEESSYALMAEMDQRGFDRKDPRIWFGQLYGMSDHISFNLAGQGYNVAKYLPFGPVRDVMPYLIRRAEENTSVAGQTNRELELLRKERKRRGM
ncbi:proline dehydrogenase family protein [Robiginitalea sp. M366]|uniref:proline dehydrogenase family protein n=1 Tax=Robiginitalea aestuariiviva TaxID=3036903 RepID=UPI00240E2F43|nr:proline dehydrogenase family protein [Robiginitalea aestuariiviva]MDG1572986.1 proline dehydrogenase family protein [Robiginitalea aestuariiviva]